MQTEKSPFSIDQNVWGRAIETGFLEDPWNGPTKDCYSYTDDPAFPPVEDESSSNSSRAFLSRSTVTTSPRCRPSKR